MAAAAGGGRRRTQSNTTEDNALNMIAREAEARLAAKRAARAEARSIRMKELERMQREADEEMDKEYKRSLLNEEVIKKRIQSHLTTAAPPPVPQESFVNGPVASESQLKTLQDNVQDLEQKYRSTMVNIAQLDNERQALLYQVDCLKERLEDEEEVAENLRVELAQGLRENSRLSYENKKNIEEIERLQQMVAERDRILEEHNINIEEELMGITSPDGLSPRTNESLAMNESVEIDHSGSSGGGKSRDSSRRSSVPDDKELLLEQIRSLKEEVCELRRENETETSRMKEVAVEEIRPLPWELSTGEGGDTESHDFDGSTFVDVTGEAEEIDHQQRVGSVINNNEKNEDFEVIDHGIHPPGGLSNFEDKSYEGLSTSFQTESIDSIDVDEFVDSEMPVEISVDCNNDEDDVVVRMTDGYQEQALPVSKITKKEYPDYDIVEDSELKASNDSEVGERKSRYYSFPQEEDEGFETPPEDEDEFRKRNMLEGESSNQVSENVFRGNLDSDSVSETNASVLGESSDRQNLDSDKSSIDKIDVDRDLHDSSKIKDPGDPVKESVLLDKENSELPERDGECFDDNIYNRNIQEEFSVENNKRAETFEDITASDLKRETSVELPSKSKEHNESITEDSKNIAFESCEPIMRSQAICDGSSVGGGLERESSVDNIESKSREDYESQNDKVVYIEEGLKDELPSEGTEVGDINGKHLVVEENVDTGVNVESLDSSEGTSIEGVVEGSTVKQEEFNEITSSTKETCFTRDEALEYKEESKEGNSNRMESQKSSIEEISVDDLNWEFTKEGCFAESASLNTSSIGNNGEDVKTHEVPFEGERAITGAVLAEHKVPADVDTNGPGMVMNSLATSEQLADEFSTNTPNQVMSETPVNGLVNVEKVTCESLKAEHLNNEDSIEPSEKENEADGVETLATDENLNPLLRTEKTFESSAEVALEFATPLDGKNQTENLTEEQQSSPTPVPKKRKKKRGKKSGNKCEDELGLVSLEISAAEHLVMLPAPEKDTEQKCDQQENLKGPLDQTTELPFDQDVGRGRDYSAGSNAGRSQSMSVVVDSNVSEATEICEISRRSASMASDAISVTSEDAKNGEDSDQSGNENKEKRKKSRKSKKEQKKEGCKNQ